MVQKWQILCSLILALTFAFPRGASAAIDKHSASTKRAARTSPKKALQSGLTGTSKGAATRNSSRVKTKVAMHKKSRAKTKVATHKKSRAKTKVAKHMKSRAKTKVAKHMKSRAKTKVATRRWRTKIATAKMMWSAPINTSPLSPALSARMKANFQRGQAGRHSPQDMVRAKVFTNAPLVGGIRPRTATVKNVIIHSTETAKVADAKTVVHSWNKGGLSHPGTQYLVDRDGKIYQTVDPKYATIHVNDNRTICGITNDNSIGIEIVRTGKQKYTQPQLAALVQLVDYVQERFPVSKIYGHGQIQPSNRTDPVAFDWNLFSRNLALINSASTQTAYSEDVRDDNQG